MYVYLQIFLKDLEFSDCKMPTLTLFPSVCIVFECTGSRHALTVTWSHQVPSVSGQTNTVCQTFACVCFGDKGKGTRCYLKVMKYCVKW